jgi:hypothetical protein
MSPAVLASEVRADLDSAAERYRALSAASRS